jgi:PBSX family phage terminase large subunit
MQEMSKKENNLGPREVVYEPHKYQFLFHASPERFRALVSGIGGGKTLSGCWEALRIMRNYPGSLGMIVAPTFPMMRDVTERTFLEILPPEWVKSHHRMEGRTILINGSEVVFRSASEPDHLRGPNLGWVYLDEAALVSEMAWRICLGRLRKPPERAWVTTTPKGRQWVWDVFINRPLHDKTLQKDYWNIQYSSKENPHLTRTYLDSLDQAYTGVFYKQEVLGEFVGFEGLVYPSFQRNIHVLQTLPEMKQYLGAADFGFTNPSVFLVVGVDYDDRLYVVDELYQAGLGLEEYVKQARALKERYGVTQVYADPASPEYIQSLCNAGVSTEGIKREVMEGISIVSQRLAVAGDNRPRLYVHERCVNTITEFENYRYPEKKEDKPQQEKPIKLYDHALDSISYLCFALNSRAPVQSIGNLTDLTSGR